MKSADLCIIPTQNRKKHGFNEQQEKQYCDVVVDFASYELIKKKKKITVFNKKIYGKQTQSTTNNYTAVLNY